MKGSLFKLWPVLFSITGIYLAVFGLIGNYDAFWSEDGGVKYLQARSLVRSGWRESAIEYPGVEIDSVMEFNPLAGTHTYLREGRIRSIYPLPFPFLSSLFLGPLGFPGLYLLPLLSTFVLFIFVFRLGSKLSGAAGGFGALATAAFASPLFFYAFTFWEINLAAALLTAGLYLALKTGPGSPVHKPLLAGAVMGSAVFFRTELALFPVAYILVRLAERRDRSYCFLLAAGAAAAGAGFIVLQYLTEGALFTHLLHNIAVRPEEFTSVTGFVDYKWDLARELLFAGHPDRRINLLLLAPAIALGIRLFIQSRPGSPSPCRLLPSVPVLLTAVLGVYLYYILNSLLGAYPIRSTPFVSGLLVFSPWVVVGFYRARRGLQRELSRTALLFILLMALAVPTSGGLQWGPRYLAPVYPLLAIVAWSSFLRLRESSGRRRWLTAVFIALLAASALHQAWGLRLLRGKKEFNRDLVASVRAAGPRTVVAVPWWVPLNLAPVYEQKEIFVARGPGALSRLLDRLEAAGREEFLLVTEADPRIIKLVEDFHRLRPLSAEAVSSGVDAYFSVLVLRYRLPRPGSGTGIPVE